VKNLKLVLGFLIVLLSGCWIYLQYFDIEEIKVKEVALEIVKKAPDPSAEAPKKGEINIGCYIWGPFRERESPRIAEKLRKAGLISKAVMKDRFLPEKFIVYLGPFDNQEAALAFQKQFRKQGYRNARAILQGGLSFGVEIAAFNTQEDAQKFLTGPRTPKVKGVRITNRLGEPSGEVDFAFQDISEDERLKLLDLWRDSPRSELKNCSF
jgi:hypothetical protein